MCVPVLTSLLLGQPLRKPSSFHTHDTAAKPDEASPAHHVALPVFPGIDEGMEESMLRVFAPSDESDAF